MRRGKMPESVIFKDHIFCLTGNFATITRKEIKDRIESLGGVISGTMSQRVHYLVYGGQGSQDYLYGAFGTKYATAALLLEHGRGNIKAILPEDMLIKAMENMK